MGKIGDLFVRLGIKDDEFKKGIQKAKNETSSFGTKMAGVSKLAVGAWAAVAAAVVKFAKDAVKLTQTWGDQWAIEMAGVKGAYQSFVRQLSSGDGWSDLFRNMGEAARVAKEVAASLDEVFERRISLSYEEAQTNKAISELQLVMRDSSKSDQERMDAAKQIIALEEQLGKTKRSIAQQEADAQKQLFMSQTGLTSKETDLLLKNYNINRDSINQARAYIAEKKRLENDIEFTKEAIQYNPSTSLEARLQIAQDALNALGGGTSQAIKDIAKLTQKYDKSSDELVQNMANAEIAVINVDTEINRASTRATAMLGSLTKANGGGSASSGPDMAKEAEKIKQRAEDAAKSEVAILTEKYAAEKALLETYNMDTEALTAEYLNNLLKDWKDEVAAEVDALTELEPVTIEPVKIEVDSTKLDEFVEKYEKQMQMAGEITRGFESAVVGGISNGCQEIMDQLMGVTDANTGAVIKALLEPIADMAIRTGEIIIAEGIAVEAARTALTSFVGVGAIVAGAALIAAGTAAKAGLSAIANNGATTASAGSSSSSHQTASQSIESSMTIYVTGRISGSDILISGEKTQTAWSR